MLKCPRCDYKINILEMERETALIQVIKLAGVFGAHSGLFLEYAVLRGAGKPINGQELKLLRILEDLEKLWNGGKFSYQKRTFSVSQKGIVEALKMVCNHHFDEPLGHDNYFKKVMIPIAEAEEKKRMGEREKELIGREREQVSSGARSRVQGLRSDNEKRLMDLDPEVRKAKFDEFRKATGGKNE